MEQFESASEWLGELGPFARHNAKFVVRQSQLAMSQAVETAIQKSQTLVAESGTGTGKTFAYLVPALLSDKRTLISTGTRHLQEQLFYRDVPVVLKHLNKSVDIALLKGRSNYLCLERYHQACGGANRLSPKNREELVSMVSWLNRTKAGDLAELAELEEDSRVRPMVTSTVDNCLGQVCEFFEDCFVNKARKKAQDSQIVVINHHLYFADKVLKEDGFGRLLPDADTLIFDEAHQITEVAGNFLGRTFSSWQVMDLLNDVRLAEAKDNSQVADLLADADKLEKLLADQRLSLGLQERRVSWDDLIEENPSMSSMVDALAQALANYRDVLETASVAGEALHRCYERAIELHDQCAHFSSHNSANESIRWLEIARRSFRLNDTPLHLGEELGRFFNDEKQATIFTSATLSVGGDFSHFNEHCGLPETALSECWDSPFDYYNQAVLYVPEGLPNPRDVDYIDKLLTAVHPVIDAAGGRTFLLFTSFRVMQQMAEMLIELEYSILVQGERSKLELLKCFVDGPETILLGTMSFWEGVDVSGDALQCVIIDKLPFESPFDPVLKARLAALEKAGENPFMGYQVPRAVITLRQGAGRLIRSIDDRGVLMICDARLRTARYGKVFLDSLPPMRRVSDEEKICSFLRRI